MIIFNKLREKSKNTFSTGNRPVYKIDVEAKCNNKCLIKEVERKLAKGKQRISIYSGLTFNWVGCCEIGQFTGNEIIQVLLDYFNTERFQPGKQICLNAEGHSVAMLIFTNVSCLVLAPLNPNENEINSEYKGLYTKLFNEKNVKSFQGGKNKDKYKQELIDKYRQEAKDLFYQFLSTRILDFTHVEHRNCFLGLVAKCAFRMSSIDPVREINDEVEKVPCLACIEIAFRSGETGMISDLLGELRRTSNDDNAALEEIGSTTINTSKKLIYE